MEALSNVHLDDSVMPNAQMPPGSDNSGIFQTPDNAEYLLSSASQTHKNLVEGLKQIFDAEQQGVGEGEAKQKVKKHLQAPNPGSDPKRLQTNQKSTGMRAPCGDEVSEPGTIHPSINTPVVNPKFISSKCKNVVHGMLQVLIGA
ncbi:hypothetical protein M407DRAFT_27919 [Tulasnella calospora MUT 4182]|uniref:Uncharacterized protein n=1 Tax=Tulasnella calospora MUT 4182 TaxID=1051891 RepID=A0A0C3QD17_9AGAM|nr:hypothetical protein M407DRAFT_27919 [Tulasnella calospora MUT 4182]